MRLIVLFMLCLSQFSFASDFQADPACVQGAGKAFAARLFGGDKDSTMDDDSLDHLCQGNNAKTAVDCVNYVARRESKMHAIGLADVCSQGVSGAEALNCLNRAAAVYDESMSVKVDLCNPTNFKFQLCNATDRKAMRCPATVPTAADATVGKP